MSLQLLACVSQLAAAFTLVQLCAEKGPQAVPLQLIESWGYDMLSGQDHLEEAGMPPF